MTAATADPGVPQDLIDRAMQLPPASRARLGHLLLDSVAAAGQAARELIRERVGQLVRGEAELLDADDVVADLERRYAPGATP